MRRVEHVVVLTLDGFRYDYLEIPEVHIPNLSRLSNEGVFYRNFHTVFPSSTYPAHAALLSGCKTGIMGLFKPQGSPYDSPVDSIMQSAQRQGLVAVNLIGYEIKLYHPGEKSFEVLKEWKRPEGIYEKGTKGHRIRSEGQKKHAEEIIWALENIRPNVMYCRLPATDWAGHANGALDSPDEDCRKAMLEMIKETDRLIGEIVKTLDELWGRENYVMFITADHGMSYAPSDVHVKEMEKFLAKKNLRVEIEGDVIALIYVRNGKKREVVDLLVAERKRFRIGRIFWKREEMETLYGSFKSDEGPDIVLEPLPTFRYVESKSSLLGSHNTFRETDAHVPLVCFGSRVKRGYSTDIERSIVDITPTVSHVLGIDPPSYSRGEILAEIFVD